MKRPMNKKEIEFLSLCNEYFINPYILSEDILESTGKKWNELSLDELIEFINNNY